MAGKTRAIPAEHMIIARGGILIVVTAAVLFSSLIIFVRQLTGLSAVDITFYRFLFAFLLFCIPLLFDRSPLRFGEYRDSLPLLLLLGFVMPMCSVLYAYGIQHIPAAAAALLCNTSPIYVALFSPLILKESRPRYTWISLALGVIGLVLVTGLLQTGMGRLDVLGTAAATGAGVFYSIPLFIGRKLKGRVSGQTQAWFGTGMGALIMLPFAASSLPGAVGQLPLLIPMGILSLGASYLLIFLSLNHVRAQTASIGMLAEPVSGVLIGLLLFSEPLSTAGFIGCGLILLAIILISVE